MSVPDDDFNPVIFLEELAREMIAHFQTRIQYLRSILRTGDRQYHSQFRETKFTIFLLENPSDIEEPVKALMRHCSSCEIQTINYERGALNVTIAKRILAHTLGGLSNKSTD